MRLVLLVLLALTSVGASAQGLYLPVGETGFSLSAATTFNDGDVTDGSIGAVATVTPRLDLAAEFGVFELGSRTGQASGAGLAYYLEADGPTRTAVTVSAGRTSGDVPTATTAQVGVFAARQIVKPGFVFVPRVAIGVGAAFGDRIDSGIQTSAAVDAALMSSGRFRVYLAPGVSLNSEARRFLLTVRAGVLTF